MIQSGQSEVQLGGNIDSDRDSADVEEKSDGVF